MVNSLQERVGTGAEDSSCLNLPSPLPSQVQVFPGSHSSCEERKRGGGGVYQEQDSHLGDPHATRTRSPQLQGRDPRNKQVLYLLAWKQFVILLPWVTPPHQRLWRTIGPWGVGLQREGELGWGWWAEGRLLGKRKFWRRLMRTHLGWGIGRHSLHSSQKLLPDALNSPAPVPGFCTALKPRPSSHEFRDTLPTPHPWLYPGTGRVFRSSVIPPQLGAWGSD